MCPAFIPTQVEREADDARRVAYESQEKEDEEDHLERARVPFYEHIDCCRTPVREWLRSRRRRSWLGIPPSLWKLPVRFALTIDARGVSVNNKMPLFEAR